MHWRNSNFQIAYFLAGKCHTVDGAYKMLCELREDRDVAIRTSVGANLRAEAKKVRAAAVIASDSSEADKLEARADLAEIEAVSDQSKAAYEQALRERDFIDELIKRLKDHPKRVHRGLTDHEAHQACQREEWRLELVHRAQTFLFTMGTIPQDHLSTMMAHPDFKELIAPKIDALMKMDRMATVNLDTENELVKLLGGPDGA